MIYEHDKTFTDGDGRLASAGTGGGKRKRGAAPPAEAGEERGRRQEQRRRARREARRLRRKTVREALMKDDVGSLVASYLDAPSMSRLASTCVHFGGALDGDGDRDGDQSLCNRVAAKMFRLLATKREREELLERLDDESCISRYHQLLLRRRPLEFATVLGGDIGHVPADDLPPPLLGGGTSAEGGVGDRSTVRSLACSYNTNTAVCSEAMRAGAHYAEFTASGAGAGCRVGLVRPVLWSSLPFERRSEVGSHISPLVPSHGPLLLECCSERWGDSPFGKDEDIHCVMYDVGSGLGMSSSWDGRGESRHRWEGMEALPPGGGTVGLLLDLDDETLTVFRDGRRLGVLYDGLRGEYSWACALACVGDKARVTVRRMPVPGTSW